MTWIVLDAPADLAHLHDQVAAHPAVPDHYGRNLDALADVLTTLPAPVGVAWRGYGARRRLGAALPRVEAALDEAHGDRPDLVVVRCW